MIFPVIKYSFLVFCMSRSSISEDFNAHLFLILVFQWKFLSYWHASEGYTYIPDDRHIVDEVSLQSQEGPKSQGFWKILFVVTKLLDRCSRITWLCVVQVFLIRFKICCYWDQVCNFQNYLHPCLVYLNTFLHQDCQSLKFLPLFLFHTQQTWIHGLMFYFIFNFYFYFIYFICSNSIVSVPVAVKR